MAYASLGEAKEVIGGLARALLTIDLQDYESISPAGGFWDEGDKTLYLGDERDGRWSYAAGLVMDVQPLVQSWGTMTNTCGINEAFGSVPDMRITLKNVKTDPQEDNSQYNLGARSPAMDPEPTGDEVRLSELLQFYIMTGAPATVAMYFFDDADTTIASAVKHTLFAGYISNVEITRDTVRLDLVQRTDLEDTAIPPRTVDDPPARVGQDQPIPIVYGRWLVEPGEVVSGSYSPSLVAEDHIVSGSPYASISVIPWQRVADSDDYQLVFNDTTGLNSGWTAGKTGWYTGTDALVIPHPEFGGTSFIKPIPSSNATTTTGETKHEANDTEQSVLVNHYQTARVYIPAVAVHASTVTPADANKEYAFDGKYTTAYSFPIETANDYIDWRIAEVPRLGTIVPAADVMGAYIFLKPTTIGTPSAPNVDFGMWRLANPNWVGSGPVSVCIDATAASNGGLYTQQNLSVLCPINSFFQDRPTNTIPEPICDWRWQYSDAATSAFDEMVIRIRVDTAGETGDTLDIVAVGLFVDYQLATYQTRYVSTRHVGSRSGSVGGPGAGGVRKEGR